MAKPNGNHHRVAARVVSKIERSQPATSVHDFALAVFRARARTRCRIFEYEKPGKTSIETPKHANSAASSPLATG